MKGNRLMILLVFVMLIFIDISALGYSICTMTVNPDNTGACTGRLGMDEEGEIVVTDYYCKLETTNEWGQYDCALESEE